MDHNSRVKLEINLTKLSNNFAQIRRRVTPCALMAVLKANAYGLGVRPIAQLLKSAGADFFGVAEINEAIELHDLGVPIQVLGNLLPHELESAVAINLICPLNNYAMAEIIDREAKRQNKVIRGAVTIDSGMGRLGMVAEEAFDEIQKMRQLKNIEIIAIYSHFSSAFTPNDPYTPYQMTRFKKLFDQLQASGMRIPYVHIGASDAIGNFPESIHAPFNLARCGINMYGYYDNSVAQSMHLEPVVELKTYLASVRELPAGSSIGYGRMHKLLQKSRVGTIAAGYADGLPLALSNRGYVLIRGVLCPVLGRISMDYTTVLLDHAPDAVPGDEVVCIGAQGDRILGMDQWSSLKGTHAYDILCSIGTRVKRVYLNQ